MTQFLTWHCILYLQKRGQAPFHFVYHKCSSCGSYNTRLL